MARHYGRSKGIAINPIPSTDPTLAVTYCRVSSAEQAKDGYGLDAQATAIEAFVRREGLTVKGRFSDPGVSGTTPLEQRAGLTAALDATISMGAGALVVARHDRLARETLQALLIEQAFRLNGVRILYAEGDNGQGENADFLRTIMHATAEQTKRELVRKLRQGRAEKAKEHPGSRAHGGRVPYGYRRTHTRLVIDDEQAAEVRRIFDLVRSGSSLKATARAMSTAEHAWHPTAIERIVKREVYKKPLAKGERPLVDGRVWAAANRALEARRPAWRQSSI